MVDINLKIAPGLVLFLLIASIASAAVEVQTEDLTIPVDYGSLRKDDEKVSISQAVTLTNSGTAAENITNIALQNLPSGYTLRPATTTLTLAPGASQDITLTGEIPAQEDAGTKTIGQLKITASTEVTKDLQIKVRPMVKISKLHTRINAQADDTVDDKDTIKKLAPGDKLELRFRVENLFDDDYDNGRIDGTIELDLDDSDFGKEINVEKDFRVDAGKELRNEDEEIVFEITIPPTAEEDEYKLSIKLDAEDENNANYKETWEVTLEVERKNDDVRVDSFTITPQEVSCVRAVKAMVKVTNYGSDRQNNAALVIANTELNLNQKVEFTLPPGDSNVNFVTQDVDVEIPATAAAKTYQLSATALYNLDVFGDRKTVPLVVKECGATPAPATTPEETTPIAPAAGSSTSGSTAGATSPSGATVTYSTSASNEDEEDQDTEADQLSSSTVVRTVEEVYTTDDYIVATMIVGAVVTIGLLIIFFLMLL